MRRVVILADVRDGPGHANGAIAGLTIRFQLQPGSPGEHPGCRGGHEVRDRQAYVARLTNGCIAPGGEHGAFVFTLADGKELTLALRLEELPQLARAAALLYSQPRRLRGDGVPPIPVETWSTGGTPDVAVLTLKVFGGLELQFEVSRRTKDRGDKD